MIQSPQPQNQQMKMIVVSGGGGGTGAMDKPIIINGGCDDGSVKAATSYGIDASGNHYIQLEGPPNASGSQEQPTYILEDAPGGGKQITFTNQSPSVILNAGGEQMISMEASGPIAHSYQNQQADKTVVIEVTKEATPQEVATSAELSDQDHSVSRIKSDPCGEEPSQESLTQPIEIEFAGVKVENIKSEAPVIAHNSTGEMIVVVKKEDGTEEAVTAASETQEGLKGGSSRFKWSNLFGLKGGNPGDDDSGQDEAHVEHNVEGHQRGPLFADSDLIDAETQVLSQAFLSGGGFVEGENSGNERLPEDDQTTLGGSQFSSQSELSAPQESESTFLTEDSSNFARQLGTENSSEIEKQSNEQRLADFTHDGLDGSSHSSHIMDMPSQEFNAKAVESILGTSSTMDLMENDPLKSFTFGEDGQLHFGSSEALLSLAGADSSFAHSSESNPDSDKLKSQEFLNLLDSVNSDPLNALASAALSTASSLAPVETSNLSAPDNSNLSMGSQGETSQGAVKQEIEEEKSTEEKQDTEWMDVGFFRENKQVIKNYYELSEKVLEFEPDADLSKEIEFIKKKIELEPGTAYKFRVAAVNACGRGPWSEVLCYSHSCYITQNSLMI